MAKPDKTTPRAPVPDADGAGQGRSPVPAQEPAAPEVGADTSRERQEALERQVADLRDRWARARADYDNLAKRVERDSALERDRAKLRVLEGFLPVFELAQAAAASAQENPSLFSEGVVLMAREFERLLAREGVDPVGVLGEPFDARRHEAVATEGAPGVAPGRVSRIVQPGYRVGDKVLRFAKVAVAPAG